MQKAKLTCFGGFGWKRPTALIYTTAVRWIPLLYLPDNCKWATRKEQSFNRTNTIKVIYNNETLSLKDCCLKYAKITYAGVIYRLKHGWTLEEALTTARGQ